MESNYKPLGQYIEPINIRNEHLEVDLLLGDSTKARKVLKWKPDFSFKALVKMMVESDFDKVNKGIKLQ